MTKRKLKQAAQGAHSKLQNIPFETRERKFLWEYFEEVIERLKGITLTLDDSYPSDQYPSAREINRAADITREGAARLIRELRFLELQKQSQMTLEELRKFYPGERPEWG